MGDFQPINQTASSWGDRESGVVEYDQEQVDDLVLVVFAGDERINLMQFDGSDGNGYYGTGYSILVRPVTP